MANTIEVVRNEKLDGIEVKGALSEKQDAWLRAQGFYFSRRKGHYYTKYDAELFEQVKNHFTGRARKVKTLGEAAPVEVGKALAKKAGVKTKEKTAPKQEQEQEQMLIKLPASTEDAISQWKREVLKAVEAVLDSAIEGLTV